MSDGSEFDVNWRPKPMRGKIADILIAIGVTAIIVAALLYVDMMRPS